MHHSVRKLLSDCGVEMWPTAEHGYTAVRRDDPDNAMVTFDPLRDVISVPYIEGLITRARDVPARCRQEGPDIIIYTEPGKTIRILNTDLALITSEPDLHFHIVRSQSSGSGVWISL